MDLEEREIELDAHRRMAELKIKGMEMKLGYAHKMKDKYPQKMKGKHAGGHHKIMCPIFMLVVLVVSVLLSVWVYQDIRSVIAAAVYGSPSPC